MSNVQVVDQAKDWLQLLSDTEQMFVNKSRAWRERAAVLVFRLGRRTTYEALNFSSHSPPHVACRVHNRHGEALMKSRSGGFLLCKQTYHYGATNFSEAFCQKFRLLGPHKLQKSAQASGCSLVPPYTSFRPGRPPSTACAGAQTVTALLTSHLFFEPPRPS